MTRVKMCDTLFYGKQFFPFREDTFSDARKNNFDRITSPEKVSIFLKEKN